MFRRLAPESASPLGNSNRLTPTGRFRPNESGPLLMVQMVHSGKPEQLDLLPPLQPRNCPPRVDSTRSDPMIQLNG